MPPPGGIGLAGVLGDLPQRHHNRLAHDLDPEAL
jgi:hypothetical protein